MESKLYVGNLSYTAREEDVRELFAQAGAVKSVMIMMDRETGRARGFAFVEMETNADAQNAINMFNGKDFQARPLTVNIARPRDDRGGGGGGGFGGGRRDDRGYGGGGGGGGRRDDRGGRGGWRDDRGGDRRGGGW